VSGLEALAQLQDLDVRLSQLEHRLATLPELAEREQINAAQATLAAQDAELEGHIAVFQREQKRHEDEVASLEEKVAKSNEALYGGAITSPKEASAMQDEIASLGRRQESIEDEILELMEQIEPLDVDRTALAEQAAQLDTQMAAVEARMAEASLEIESERTEVQARRDALVESTSDELVALYDSHRAKMRDRIAIGRLTGATCGACHLEISAVDLDRIRSLGENEPGECPECGALLVH